jgi:selenide,water dikinase
VELAEQGNLTGGCKRNRDFLSDKVAASPSVGAGLVEIAFDPQTSGGLLIAVPQSEANALVEKLHAGGVTVAAVVGRAEAHQGVWVRLE